tara:strand:- start:7 stop:282 length:276 start_codon:yes stop_codon:yes gene_type:complete
METTIALVMGSIAVPLIQIITKKFNVKTKIDKKITTLVICLALGFFVAVGNGSVSSPTWVIGLIQNIAIVIGTSQSLYNLTKKAEQTKMKV